MNPPSARYSDHPGTQRAIQRLIDAADELPRALFDDLRSGGDEIARALIEVVKDRELRYIDAPGGGWAPVHAARILGARRQPEAVNVLVAVVDEADVEALIYSSAVFALQEIGAPARQPVLDAINAAGGVEQALGLAEVLSELGVQDDRILALLLEVTHVDIQLGASFLASYGDPAALPALHSLFEPIEANPVDPFENHVITELAAAIEALGGELLDEEQAKVDQARRIRDAIAAAVFTEDVELRLEEIFDRAEAEKRR